MATRQEQINEVLERFMGSAGQEVAGVAAVSTDGIVLVSQMSADVNAERVGAVAATMLGVTRRVSTELRIGGVEETILKANTGLFMVLPAGENAVLAVNLRQGANLGMVRLEARDAAQDIGLVI